jgi:hypothetical protein
MIVAANSEEVLRSNILQSRAARQVPVFVERDYPTAGLAYNAGLKKSEAAYLIFVHQDVYIPDGWLDRLQQTVDNLERSGTPWGVLGVWGIAAPGKYCGKVWCTGGNQEHVGRLGLLEVVSIDEILIVLKRSTGLRFDEKLPGFHLYATDIVLEARKRGLKTFVIDAPVVHNSRANPQPLDRYFRAAYRYMQQKWSDELPLVTCVVSVTRAGWPLWKQWGRNSIAHLRGRFLPHPRLVDPAIKARELGYEAGPTPSDDRPHRD